MINLRKSIITICLLTATTLRAQVTYFGTNNFFLNYLTDTGFSGYDWRYEPLKTDVERGGLKGKVYKVVTNIEDKTNRGWGDNFCDTAYYDAMGNITKVVALKKDQYSPEIKYNPDLWIYAYNTNGTLLSYVIQKEDYIYGGQGKTLNRHVHTMSLNNQGRILQEIYKAYEKQGNAWKPFDGSLDDVSWTFSYDTSGNLTGGYEHLHQLNLTYLNGQLTKMESRGEEIKPVTFSYNSEGQMIGCRYFQLDEWEGDEFRSEIEVVMRYNEHGHLVGAIENTWDCAANWSRVKLTNNVTYSVSYTYDNKDNWTKAIMYSLSNNSPREIAFTINREISYK